MKIAMLVSNTIAQLETELYTLKLQLKMSMDRLDKSPDMSQQFKDFTLLHIENLKLDISATRYELYMLTEGQ